MGAESGPKWPSTLLLWIVTAGVGALLLFAAVQNNILVTAAVMGVVGSYAVFGAGWVIWAARQATKPPRA
ncbi:hypothetical protein Q4F19_10430 [Sphingomonas sp. BIUV-7]|uniref:Uncharacterized protein n=1 Tax=Sphingomonas natans TaxID=3063330 RepID=A0ABT8YAW5_9SPHN|nr:hypothetical protein [Sphingomonas sp. BIUV-7]MDO6414795.1 hypothetical protein [Sphingomonas sp. BIUV-7]